MDIPPRVGSAGRLIDFGVVTTEAERAAVLAQRFRVYQRRRCCRPGLRVDRDEYERRAVYFLATMDGAEPPDAMGGSTRVIFGEQDAGFTFPAETALRFELPEAI